MPELPEVETIRRVLEPQLKGKLIRQVRLSRPEIISAPTAEEFCRRAEGERICSLGRRGKFLQIELHSGAEIVLHLRMSGCLLLAPKEYPLAKHTHAIFELEEGEELRFSDVRRFGRLWLLAPGQEDCTGRQKLGLEPFDPQLTPEYLQQIWGKKKRPIKDCMLDQQAVAGIGNIYSDEILFRAGIRPDCLGCNLEEEQRQRLAQMIPQTLAYFIEKNAISPQEYLDGGGRDYRNTPFLQVYGHSAQPCPRCGSLLERKVIAGRSSVFCPACQNFLGGS
jgi:formamidopyrimidine-DNA glycosylase